MFFCPFFQVQAGGLKTPLRRTSYLECNSFSNFGEGPLQKGCLFHNWEEKKRTVLKRQVGPSLQQAGRVAILDVPFPFGGPTILNAALSAISGRSVWRRGALFHNPVLPFFVFLEKARKIGHVHRGTARGAPGGQRKIKKIRATFWDSKNSKLL